MRDSSSDLSNHRTSVPSLINNVSDSKTSLNGLNTKVSSLMSSCRICLSSLFHPAALSCGHRFCERCLDQYWRVKDKPSCIVCPLCRACAFTVDFAKEIKAPSTEDFRRTFGPIIIKELDMNKAVIWCMKLSAIMPALYFLVKWLKPPFEKLFSFLNVRSASRM